MTPETHDRMYDSVRWRKARASFLAAHPLCAMCAKVGRDTAANTVDHKIPHGGDPVLFWDQDNWQALCKQHHDSSKRIKDNKGIYPGCDVNGFPLDSDHLWNKKT